MKERIVREDGLYLVLLQCATLSVIELETSSSGVLYVKVLGGEEEYYIDSDIDDDATYKWIASTPLNMKDVFFMHGAGGIDNIIREFRGC